ncbi:MAG: HAMP domain-containing sensor histidine kinase [candidate division FCPU426 bacterium]
MSASIMVRKHWPVIVGGVILGMTLSAVGVIWMNIRDFERQRNREHFDLAQNIARTSMVFINNLQYDYFHQIIRLLTQISFIPYMDVNLEGKTVLRSGLAPERFPSWPERAADSWVHLDAKQNLVFVQQPLELKGVRNAELRMVFSQAGFQQSKQMIGYAIVLILVLLSLTLFFMSLLARAHLALAQAEKNKSEMIRRIAHDAKQELTVIVGKTAVNLSRLKKGPGNEQLERDLKLTQESAESIENYLNNLNDQSKLAAGQTEIIAADIDIVKVIRNVLESHAETVAQYGLKFIFEPAAAPCRAWADPHAVKRVLVNLIHNAIKYSSPGSVIEIKVETNGLWQKLFVRDQGAGIAPENWEKIFEPYVQIDPKGKGMGLGLTNARQLIRRLGGELKVIASQKGRGTTFAFTLPIHEMSTPVTEGRAT